MLGAGQRLGRRAFLVAAVAPLATVGWALSVAPSVLDGEPETAAVGWVPELGLALDLRLDAFALLMVGLVSGIGVLVFVYAHSYFSDRPDLGRFAATLTAFAGSMLGLVLSDNLLGLFLFWELTSVTSYLLIGFDDTKASARAAALQAILITGVGGLAMLGGFVVIGLEAGTFSLSEVLAAPPSGTAVDVALVLVLIGACTKSAQAPFHSWLPGAMAAPTPVSAYLHSATMVKAGIYLVARFAPAFATAAPWRPIVLTVGLVTMLLGGLRALRQHDLKLLLAYGTISQLGFLLVLLGVGLPEATLAGCALLVAHGVFKAALFMLVGIVDHQAHTRDLRRLHELRHAPGWRPAMVVAALSAGSMAGIPLLVGFVSKEAAYEALIHGGVGAVDTLVLAGVVVGSILTFAYSARFLRGTFGPTEHDDAVEAPKPPSRSFVGPTVILAAITVTLGVLPDLASDLVSSAAGALDATVEPVHLKLWHGLNLALGLSVLTVGLGSLLAWRWRSVEAFQGSLPGLGSSDGAYGASLVGLNRLADRTVAVVQSGSLPIYLGVILLTLLALPGGALLVGGDLPALPPASETPLQIAVAVVMAVAAIGAAVAVHRYVAVLLLGFVGYGMAAFFVIQGAPDLALTQMLVETVTLLIFVFVLRRLPARAVQARWRLGTATRLFVAAGVGLMVTGFALVAGGSRTREPISGAYLERALPDGGGSNVVNVILVDFRGLDTLGEITVLAVAALGILSLTRVVRGRAEGPTAAPLEDGQP
ncbi:MAG: hydrogen gas-evolving membrane-bound hydrogenase subunit E [Acidimicrobiales bacterium]